MSECDTFWGSHGCDKPSGHVAAGDPVHVCEADGLCSEARLRPDGQTEVRFYYDGDEPGQPSGEWRIGFELFGLHGNKDWKL